MPQKEVDTPSLDNTPATYLFNHDAEELGGGNLLHHNLIVER